MRFLAAVAFLSLIVNPPHFVRGDSIDGRVTLVRLPAEDITLYHMESKGAFTVKLETKSAVVEGQKMYVGDGKVAVELVAHATNGIFLQGVMLPHGSQLRNGSTIKVKPGYKKAADLAPGNVYVTLSGVAFEQPAK